MRARVGIRIWAAAAVAAGAVLVVMSLVANAAFKEPPVGLKGVDVYRTDAFTTESVEDEFKRDLKELVDDQLNFKMKEAAEIQAAVVAKLKARGSFAYLDLSVVGYPLPHRGYFITVDVVDEKDKAERMPFRDAPTGSFEDPDGLFATWGKYTQVLLKLSQSGKLKAFDPKDCPVLYCMARFDDSDLKEFLPQFNEGAVKNADQLMQIAIEDKDAVKRGTALILLAHTNDAARVMPVLTKAIYDPDEIVRNNAMLVMVSIANKGIDVDYPIADLAKALDFPTTRGRNKAVAVLDILAKSKKYRDAIRQQAVPNLLKLLHLEQPNNHDWAYETLKELSGKNYRDKDFDAWEKWAATRP